MDSNQKEQSLRTPLGAARGLGSAKDGTHHWIMMRVTSVALVPLCLYFVFQAQYYLPEPGLYTSLIVQLADPLTSVLMVLFILCGFYHACLGVQTIIEDYVHCACMRTGLLLANKIGFFALGVVSIYALLYISFALYGGGNL